MHHWKRLFFSGALLFGWWYCCWIPPFQSPDEYNHFFRAWQVSEGHFFPKKTNDMRLGGELPASVDSLKKAFAPLRFHPEQKTGLAHIRAFLQQELAPERRVFVDFPNTAIYAPPAYAPQALAIAAMRPFGVSPLGMLYGARMANLLCWIMLVYVALRQTPFLRNSLLALALLPATLVMAASVNPDVLISGLCFWLFAALLNGCIDGRAGIAMAVIALNKIIYIPLVMLACCRPDWRAAAGRWRFAALLAVALATAALGAWQASSAFISYDDYNPAYRAGVTLNEGVDPQGQLRYIVQHPVGFVRMAGASLARALPSMAAHLVGKFGWEKNYIPAWGIGLLWLALTGVVLTDLHPLGRRARWAAAAIGLSIIGLFAVMMYALWSPLGGGEISNWQGRYFLPAMPLAALALGGLVRVEKRFGWLCYLAMAVYLIGHLLMYWAVAVRYFDF